MASLEHINMANSMMDRLASMSKEELLHNCAREISKIQEQNSSLQQTIAERDATITNLRSTLSNMQTQAQLDQSVADRLIQSSRNEAQNIVDTANKKASAVTKQANDLLARANAEATKKLTDANEQANRIISEADTQASALIESRMRTAQDELDTLKGTKSALVDNLTKTLNGIIAECDSMTPVISSSFDDVTALRQTSMNVLHDLKAETYPQRASVQEQQEQESPDISDEDMSVLDGVFGTGTADSDILVPERKTKPRTPVVRRGEVASDDVSKSPQTKPQSKAQQVTTAQVDDTDDDFDVFDDALSEYGRDESGNQEDDFTFDPDSADSFTSEFLSLHTGDIEAYDADNDHDDDFDVSADMPVTSSSTKQQSQQTKQSKASSSSSKNRRKSGNKKASKWY